MWTERRPLRAGGDELFRTRPVIVCEVAAANATPVAKSLKARSYRFYEARAPQDGSR